VIEPFLIQQGLLQRTPRGRALTAHGFRHIGLDIPKPDSSQFELMEEGGDE
jgi:Holliday junction DNA helicase RuvB